MYDKGVQVTHDYSKKSRKKYRKKKKKKIVIQFNFATFCFVLKKKSGKRVGKFDSRKLFQTIFDSLPNNFVLWNFYMHYFFVFQGAHCWFKIDFARQSWRALGGGGVPLYPKFFRHLWIIWNYSEVVRMMYDNVIHLGSQVIFSSTTSTPIKRLLGLFDRGISSFDSLNWQL